MGTLRAVASYAAGTRLGAAALKPFTRHAAAVFMFHRFKVDGLVDSNHDANGLRSLLQFLRNGRYRLMSLDALVLAYHEDPASLTRAVSFRVDDGYSDFDLAAAPVFAEFDCPVTVFLPTGFVDGVYWMWWDRVLHAFRTTERKALCDDTLTGGAEWRWVNESGALAHALQVTRVLRHHRPDEQERNIQTLLDKLSVELPTAAPARYAAMSWETIRRLAGQGVTFGAHSITHPSLARLPEEQARHEIVGSWKRLNEETSAVSHVFAYPIGTTLDAGPREAGILKAEGFLGGVTTVPAHVTPSCESGYLLPSFGAPLSVTELREVAGGLDRFKTIIGRYLN